MALSDLALVTLADAKAFIDGSFVETDDAKIEDMINAASELIVRESGREFKPQATGEERTVMFDGGRLLSFAPFDARAVTAIEVRTVALTLGTHYELVPDRREPAVFVGARLAPSLSIDERELGQVIVAGDWGWPAVPEQVKRACLRLVDTWFAADGPAHAEEYGGAPDLPTSMVPMDVWGTINSYRRRSV